VKQWREAEIVICGRCCEVGQSKAGEMNAEDRVGVFGHILEASLTVDCVLAPFA